MKKSIFALSLAISSSLLAMPSYDDNNNNGPKTATVSMANTDILSRKLSIDEWNHIAFQSVLPKFPYNEKASATEKKKRKEDIKTSKEELQKNFPSEPTVLDLLQNDKISNTIAKKLVRALVIAFDQETNFFANKGDSKKVYDVDTFLTAAIQLLVNNESDVVVIGNLACNTALPPKNLSKREEEFKKTGIYALLQKSHELRNPNGKVNLLMNWV